MHSSVAESSFYCWLQFFFLVKLVFHCLKKEDVLKKKKDLLLFVRYDILKGVM